MFGLEISQCTPQRRGLVGADPLDEVHQCGLATA